MGLEHLANELRIRLEKKGLRIRLTTRPAYLYRKLGKWRTFAIFLGQNLCFWAQIELAIVDFVVLGPIFG